MYSLIEAFLYILDSLVNATPYFYEEVGKATGWNSSVLAECLCLLRASFQEWNGHKEGESSCVNFVLANGSLPSAVSSCF